MKRKECLKVLADIRRDEIVVTCWQSMNIWEQLSPSKYNFQSMRTMGDCSTFALGLALARPDKSVFALEGDGSLCMSLFSLITIAGIGPSNYYLFVLHNKIYETTGGQTIPNVDDLDFIEIAKGAGFRHTCRFGDVESFRAGLGQILQQKGPVFVVLDIEADETHIGGKDIGKVRAFDRECNKRFKAAMNEEPVNRA